MSDLLAEHQRADPNVVTTLSEGYDARIVDVAHVYRENGPHLDRPYPDHALIETGHGVRT